MPTQQSLLGTAKASRYGRKPHPISPTHAFYRQMKKNNGQISYGHYVMDHAATAMEQMELYCTAHEGSPSAIRRPHLFFRSELWIALLGPSMEEGIVGIGPTVAAALRAFDAQYLAGLRPAAETGSKVGALRRSNAEVQRTQRSPKFDLKSRGQVPSFAWPS